MFNINATGSGNVTIGQLTQGRNSIQGSQEANQTSTTISTTTIFSRPHLVAPVKLAEGLSERQKEWLQEQGLISVADGSAASILKMETILKSVCMIDGAAKGTGFLIDTNKGVAFMSAGHLFKTLLDPLNKDVDANKEFGKFKLFFGNTEGDAKSKNSVTLADFGKLKGSIAHQGRRRFFPSGDLKTDSKPDEDYCFLYGITKEQLKKKKLGSLKCGEGEYLKPDPGEVVAIFGHPGKAAREGDGKHLRPLRISYGKEKNPNPKAKTGSKEKSGNFILYDNDTLPGNSGSPVVGRGGDDSDYAVKGIHVVGICGKINCAQNLMNLDDWSCNGKGKKRKGQEVSCHFLYEGNFA